MIVTHKISMDPFRRETMPCIDVMQDDKYSRNLEIRLKHNGIACPLPEDCTVLVRYKKPDRRNGAYDTMPDGSKAWRVAGNAVTVGLAPQVCTVPGKVELTITLLRGQSELSFFALRLNVHKRTEGTESSERYINIGGFVPQPTEAAVGQYLVVAAVDDSGKVTAVETAEAAGAQGGDGKSAYAYAVEGGFTGTEAEFAERLAAEPSGMYYVALTETDGTYTADRSAADMEKAYQAGNTLCCMLPYQGERILMPMVMRAYEGYMWIFSIGYGNVSLLVGITDENVYVEEQTDPNIPSTLPNPYSLKLTGAVSAVYDGSSNVTVTVPKGLPAVTADNNGAFLRVVNGTWVAAAVTNAEEVSF